MSSAFNTIQRNKLINIAKEVLNEDEIRILRIHLAETTLEVKVQNAQKATFESKTDSPQRDSINGPLFTIYFNYVLQQLREEMGKEPTYIRDINPQWTEIMKSNPPDKMVYANDYDFITQLA